MLNSILNFIIKKPVWSLITFLIIVGSSVTQIQNFSLDASSESLSLDGDNNLELYFATQETFGSDESLIISYSAKEDTVLSKDQLISLNSKTYQNDKKKYVNLEFNEQTNKFDIQGSSFSGIASTNNIVGNWWSHKILQTDSQISPVSGSIKEQVVTFIAKEKIELYGKTYDVDHFKLTSKDMSLPKDKRLNFDIWFDKKNSLILKVTYSRLGNWEYKVKKFE